MILLIIAVYLCVKYRHAVEEINKLKANLEIQKEEGGNPSDDENQPGDLQVPKIIVSGCDSKSKIINEQD